MHQRRSKCTGALNGPTATGQHCPEGWTLYPLPGPNYKRGSGSAAAQYSDGTVSKNLEESLDRSALRAVRTWKFDPATRAGKPVVVEINVDFELPEER